MRRTKQSKQKLDLVERGSVELTVIVPVFNESRRIESSLKKICAFFENARFIESWELLIVDDGSTDLTVESVLKQVCSNLRVIHLFHGGKGAAIREGFKQARGKFILFMDCDLATPLSYVQTLVDKARSGSDIVIASRNLVESTRVVAQSKLRHILGQVFPRVVNTLFSLGVSDTQCGFKLYRRNAAKLISGLQTMNGWAFDVEHLVIAKAHKLRIVEIPVKWTDMAGTRINMIRDGFVMLFDLLVIFQRKLRGAYSPQSGKRKITSEFMSFLVIGGVSTLVDWSVFGALILFSVSNLLSLTFSYISGAIVNYVGNRFFTFRSLDKRVARQMGIFALVVACNLLISIFVFSLVHEYVFSSALVSRFFTTGIVLCLNYIMHKYITFS